MVGMDLEGRELCEGGSTSSGPRTHRAAGIYRPRRGYAGFASVDHGERPSKRNDELDVVGPLVYGSHTGGSGSAETARRIGCPARAGGRRLA